MRGQAFFEHHQAADAAVAVLERVDALELAMEVDDVFERFPGLGVVAFEQLPHLGMHLLGRAGFVASHFIGEAFVFAHIEPVFPAVGGPGLEHSMERFDQGLRQFVFGVVDDGVDAAEVVGGLHDVVHLEGLVLANPDRIGLEDVAGLLVGEPATLDVVGVIRQVNLRTVVDAAAHFALFLLTKSLQKGRGFLFATSAHGKWRIGRNAPGLAGQEGAFHLSGGAPVADGAFGQAVPVGKSSDGDIFHIRRHMHLSARICLPLLQI